jgi:hypothetical protein
MGHHSSTCVIILDLRSIFTLSYSLRKDGGPRISHWANGECSRRMDDDYLPSLWWLLLVCPTHCVDAILTSRNVWALEAVLKDFPNAGQLF